MVSVIVSPCSCGGLNLINSRDIRLQSDAFRDGVCRAVDRNGRALWLHLKRAAMGIEATLRLSYVAVDEIAAGAAGWVGWKPNVRPRYTVWSM